MCFTVYTKFTKKELNDRCNVEYSGEFNFDDKVLSGFSFPKMLTISNQNTSVLSEYNWGLIPSWAKNDEIKKFTLNARIESLKEKPAFRNSINNRCIIPINGFFEWKHLDSKGKNKQKYFIRLKNENIFSLAGLWSSYQNITTNELLHTFTIVTTQANELMSEIHNTKKRMPVVLDRITEKKWLSTEPIENFYFPKVDLTADII